jgi:heme exporter protein CcmD
MNAFLLQGGYGDYIWAAYGISVVVLAVLAILAIRARRRAEADDSGFSNQDLE